MPKTHLRAKHPKTGVEGYRVGLEVFHQLHCINLLRQVTYKDYYTKLGNGNFAGGDEELQMHTGMFAPPEINGRLANQENRSLPGNPENERPMQRRYWSLHLLPHGGRPTSMAGTQLVPSMPEFRSSEGLGFG